jgi:solute carrier family 31 (copper transporter), member 1
MKGMGETGPHGGHEASSGHAASLAHMSFFWGARAVVLFPGWPGERGAGAGAYVLCLLFVAGLAAAAEALAAVSRCVARRAAAGDGGSGRAPASSAALLTVAHAARMGLAYLVMLAVMSFNVGVLLAAVAGHALGFLLARSRVHPAAAARGGCAAASDRDLGGVHPADGSKA